MLRNIELVLLTLITAAALYVITAAADWQLQARLFPWVVSIPVFVLACTQIFLDLRAPATLSASGEESEAATSIGMWHPDARREMLRLVAWIGGFLLCIFLFSIPFGLPLAVLLYLKFESREKWPLTLALSITTWAYLYLLFDRALHLHWPEGLVTGLLFPS